MKTNHKSQITSPKLWTKIMLLLLMPVLLYSGGGYPAPQEKYVNDFAGILAATDSKTMSETLRSFEQRTGILITVVTIKNMADYGEGHADIESFAAGIFKEWGTGLENGGRGILMLVSTGDRKIKIETGDFFGAEYEDVMLDIIEKSMVPFFKQDNYSRGVYEGVREVMKKTEKKPLLQDLDMKTLAAALAAGFLAAVVFLLTRKKRESTGSKPDEKPVKKMQDRIKAPVKIKKTKREPLIFGGGASGGW